MRVKNKTTPDTWFFRFYEDQGGRRVHRNLKIGTVLEFPLRKDAEKAVLTLRANINSGVRTPETVNDLVAHYMTHELTPERKAYSTIQCFECNLRTHIVPTWGHYRLSDVKAVAVEAWLDRLPLAPGTRSKIRSQMCAIFSHGLRHEFLVINPIVKVRCSAERLREPDILTVEEFQALIAQLSLRERAMVILVGSTGLRRSEMFALRWGDVCESSMQVFVTKGVVNNQFGEPKTKASSKPVPLHSSVLGALIAWRAISMYCGESDFLFPSTRLNGDKPLSPGTLLTKIIKRAVVTAGIRGKRVGWHTFRHSLATNLRSLGVDVKVAQELLRHASCRITMDIYTQAVPSDRREASSRQTDMLMGGSYSVPSPVPSGFAKLL